jgi:hypothetical protein
VNKLRACFPRPTGTDAELLGAWENMVQKYDRAEVALQDFLDAPKERRGEFLAALEVAENNLCATVQEVFDQVRDSARRTASLPPAA